MRHIHGLRIQSVRLCRLIDCEKLSPEACTHAVQNNRLPLHTVVQVLFFEQLRLRRFVMDYLPLSDENPGHGYQKAGLGLGLNGDLVSIQARVVQLEEECGVIHRDIERLECSRSGRGLRLGAGFGVCGKRYDAVSSSTDY